MAAILPATTADFFEATGNIPLDESGTLVKAGKRLQLPVWLVGCAVGFVAWKC